MNQPRVFCLPPNAGFVHHRYIGISQVSIYTPSCLPFAPGSFNTQNLIEKIIQKQPLPSPPACASIIEVPTGMPSHNPNSAAAVLVRPLPTGSPGLLTRVPEK